LTAIIFKKKGCDVLKKILVVEDDTLLNKTLCYNLTLAGYMVDGARSAASANELIEKKEYDLIVLDINLPDGNGFDLCRDSKTRYENVLIIFLTANDMESDMIKGFDLGADDYVTKPFPINVFQRKVAALFGRITKQEGGDCYNDGNLIIDFNGMTATLAGAPVIFTPTEYRMLKVLVKNPRIVLTRQVLLEKLWDNDGNYVDEHTLTSNISRIRGKIETDDCQYIRTVYGMGYMWIGGIKNER
jgi:two-component system OmpR family response regulator